MQTTNYAICCPYGFGWTELCADVWMCELHGYQIITKNMESSKLQTDMREDLNLTLLFSETEKNVLQNIRLQP